MEGPQNREKGWSLSFVVASRSRGVRQPSMQGCPVRSWPFAPGTQESVVLAGEKFG